MKRYIMFKLQYINPDEIAETMIEEGGGIISSWDVLKAIIHILQKREIEATFLQEDDETILTMEEVRTLLEKSAK